MSDVDGQRHALLLYVLRQSVTLLRYEWTQMLLLAGMFLFANVAVIAVFVCAMMFYMAQQSASEFIAQIMLTGYLIIQFGATLFFLSIYEGAMLWLLVTRHVDASATFVESLRYGIGQARPILYANLRLLAIGLAWASLGFVPGVVWLLRRCLTVPIMIIEGKNSIDAMHRSRGLMRGQCWNALILFAGFGLAIAACIYVIDGNAAIRNFVISFILLILMPIILIEFYVSVRRQAEPFDDECMAQEIQAAMDVQELAVQDRQECEPLR